jgi:BirA family biotin operon repressor/biotin-[acetyl-CoA-carboxylase] ligase
VLLRPAARIGWLPLLAGVAVAGALRGFAEVEGISRGRMGEAALKWPNDVLIGERKLGGILAERVGGAVVIGIGLNVSLRADELPTPNATSLALEGAPADRDPVLRAILRELAARYAELDDVEALRKAYVSMCATLGRQVRVELPDGTAITGLASGIDHAARLVVGEHALSAGDVVHVR